MTDTIQTRIREYLRAENDEDVRRLLRDAADRIDALEAELVRAKASGPITVDAQWGLRASPFPMHYRAPPEAWRQR